MLPILWAEQAADDLHRIVEFIGERDAAAAQRLHDRLVQSVQPTASYPYMFREGRVDGTREIVAHPNYVIIYMVLADMILVTAVIHTRQKYP